MLKASDAWPNLCLNGALQDIGDPAFKLKTWIVGFEVSGGHRWGELVMKDPEPRGLRHSTAASVDAACSTAGPIFGNQHAPAQAAQPIPLRARTTSTNSPHLGSWFSQKGHPPQLAGKMNRQWGSCPPSRPSRSRLSPCFTQTCCQRGGRRTRGTWPMVTRPGCYRNQVSAYDQLGWEDWRYHSVQQNLSRLICHWNPGWGVHPRYDSRVFFWMISEYLYKPCFRRQQPVQVGKLKKDHGISISNLN